MRKTRIFLVFVIALSFPLAPGCVLIVLGIQRVELVVTTVAPNQGVADAIVTIGVAQSGELSGVTSLSCDGLTPAECLDQYAELELSTSGSFSEGTYVASSDADGQVGLVVTTTTECVPSVTCCPLRFCSNDPEDQVTGVDFYVRIENDGVSEILTVEFTPGNTISGEFFEVSVGSIGEPVPVKDAD